MVSLPPPRFSFSISSIISLSALSGFRVLKFAPKPLVLLSSSSALVKISLPNCFSVFHCEWAYICLPWPFSSPNEFASFQWVVRVKLLQRPKFTVIAAALAFLVTTYSFKETMIPSVTLPLPHEPANYDEVSMQQSLLFSDSLKDLKNLRTQLYSAAEYFELSYTNDDQKQIVVDTLKDYAIKALVNTVDHLGSVTYKVNDLLDEKVDEVSGTELRVSCIEQRLRTCQEYIDHEGISQQSLVIYTPKYHKRYILPVGETMHGAIRTKSKYQGCSLDDEDEWHQFRNAVRATIREAPSPSVRKGRSPSPSPRPLQRAATFLFSGSTPKKELEKRTVSPHRFPLLRSGSLSRPTTPRSRATTPNSSRPTTPNARERYPSEPRKSASMRLHPERENSREIEQYPSKSKRLLKALLSRRKSKKDDMLYTYLDEY